MAHEHGWGSWLWGGPKARDRFCAKENCNCDRECCWETQAGDIGRWVRGKWKPYKRVKK
jgi:hypothetical protein